MNINIQINGKTIELMDKQLQDIRESLGVNQVQLSDIAEGDTFKIGKYEFIVLEQMDGAAAIVKRDLLFKNKRFGDNNNYNGSNHDKLCNDFAADIAEIIGIDNMILHTVDLTADDGLKDYGTIERHMHSMTAEQQRKYVYILDKYKVEDYYALATAHSTPTHENENWVKCVSPHGRIDYDGCYDDNGVRPFCILKSNIFVSK